jgi:predicted Zn finger-like uncharacterized protein
MYTRCPGCRSVFRVTAPLLQMAAGEVRCGACGNVFNALHTLIDDWSTHGAAVEPAPAGAVHPTAPAAPGEDFEFNVPETEWQRFFISPAAAAAAVPRSEPALGPVFEPDVPQEEASPADPPPPPRSVEDETADTATWRAFLQEASEAAASPPVESPADAAREDTMEPPPDPWAIDAVVELAENPPMEALVDLADEGEALPESAAILEEPAPDAIADTVLDWGPPFPARAAAAPAHAGRWLAASVAAALVLAAQVAHYYRDRLAADPSWGNVVREVYARLGQPLNPEWPLDAYEVRDMKAIAGNTAAGGLDIVAELAVNGTRPVGLPVLRVVLRDRWSNTVGSGNFVAREYLADSTPADHVFSPGSLIPVQLTVKDPGAAAQGYELDICMPHRQRGLQCRNFRDPFRR